MSSEDPHDWESLLPSWEECNRMDKSVLKLSALERFILDNEPAGASDVEFRRQLAAVVAEAYTRGTLA